jgi:hypothetical protein
MSAAIKRRKKMIKISRAELNELLAVVEQICRQGVACSATCINERTLFAGDSVCVRWGGALTCYVADRFTRVLPLPRIRYRLNRLSESGELLKHNSAGGITSWWPVGLAAKLLEERKKVDE